MRLIDGNKKTSMNDCISRQQAIEALTEWETEPLDEDIVRTLEALPPVSQKQVTSKLKNPCNSLLKPDSDECKEQKSKLDCISREQAIEAIADIEVINHDQLNIREGAVFMLEQLPPVTPTERTGEWIEDGYYDYQYYVCSYCGQECGVQNNGVEIEPLRTKYCSNCGARMR